MITERERQVRDLAARAIGGSEVVLAAVFEIADRAGVAAEQAHLKAAITQVPVRNTGVVLDEEIGDVEQHPARSGELVTVRTAAYARL